ncbi:MAG: F0F1 ATP synthase subunit delta [Nocardioides sp.]|uniref:F0F1 ATP synthase subunit delta n=1 Tax=Nocardioides sp. TaxID=35761 RepID=UPI0039E443E3
MDFRGASAEAVAALTDQLVDQLAGDRSAADKAAGALFSAAQTFRTEPALRRYATDTTVPGEAKAGLATELFTRVDQPAAVAALAEAASRRWTRSTDLPDAVERLSEVAAICSASDGERLSAELFELRRVVDHYPDLRDALSDPTRTVGDKAGLLDSLFAGRFQDATLRLAKQALAGSYGTVPAALSSYRRLAGEIHGESVVTVHVAAPLSTDQAERLNGVLSRQYGRAVHADVVVDPTLIGGVRVEAGDEIVDGTIASRLDDARRRLAG